MLYVYDGSVGSSQTKVRKKHFSPLDAEVDDTSSTVTMQPCEGETGDVVALEKVSAVGEEQASAGSTFLLLRPADFRQMLEKHAPCAVQSSPSY